MEIGEAIKARRAAAGLTLDGLAERSGVSRAMLSEIERGAKNPTVRIVSQIAGALETTVAALLGEVVAVDTPGAVDVVRRAERRTLVEPNTGIAQQDLAPVYRSRGVEVRWYTVPRGQTTGPLPPERPGTVAHLTLIAGQLAVTAGGTRLTLAEGDAIFFPADGPYAFTNPGAEPCQFLLIVDSSRMG
jgi:transcriptional regulator with XRE-family HTH domain